MKTDGANLTGQMRHPAITAASILCFLLGTLLPIGTQPSIVYMIRNRALRVIETPFGQIRGMSGPFEALGMVAMILLALLFTGINILQLLAGYWLWKSRRKGGILEVVLLALSAIFWIGFALPFGLLVGPLMAGLLASGWKSLEGDPS